MVNKVGLDKCMNLFLINVMILNFYHAVLILHRAPFDTSSLWLMALPNLNKLIKMTPLDLTMNDSSGFNKV